MRPELEYLTNEGALSLDNKYGNIYINGWDKDSIAIVIKIEAKGRNVSKAQALLDRVNPNNTFKNKLILLFRKYPNIDIYKGMSFQENWQEEPLWRDSD